MPTPIPEHHDLLAARYVRKDLLLIAVILVIFTILLTGIKLYDKKVHFIDNFSLKYVSKFIKN